MAELKITPEAQQILMDLQTFQQQMQTVMIQKETLNIQGIETDKALEELKKATTEEIYKAVGPILIRSTKKDLEKELSEKKGDLGLEAKKLAKAGRQAKGKAKGLSGKV